MLMGLSVYLKLIIVSSSFGYRNVSLNGSRSRFGVRFVVNGMMDKLSMRKCGVNIGRFSNSLTLRAVSLKCQIFSCGRNSLNKVSASDKK